MVLILLRIFKNIRKKKPKQKIILVWHDIITAMKDFMHTNSLIKIRELQLCLEAFQAASLGCWLSLFYCGLDSRVGDLECFLCSDRSSLLLSLLERESGGSQEILNWNYSKHVSEVEKWNKKPSLQVKSQFGLI